MFPELLAHEAVDEAVAGAVQHQEEVTDVAENQGPQRKGPLPRHCTDLLDTNTLQNFPNQSCTV